MKSAHKLGMMAHHRSRLTRELCTLRASVPRRRVIWPSSQCAARFNTCDVAWQMLAMNPRAVLRRNCETVRPTPNSSDAMSFGLNLQCPYCQRQAVSFARKMHLTLFSWDKPVPCRSCGLWVCVRAYHPMRWTFPFIAGTFVVATLGGVGLLSYSVSLLHVLAVLFALLALLGVGGLLFGVPLSGDGIQSAHQRLAGAARAGVGAGVHMPPEVTAAEPQVATTQKRDRQPAREWPLYLAFGIVAVCVACYAMGWINALKIIVASLMLFPLIYAVVAFVLLKLSDKTKGQSSRR